MANSSLQISTGKYFGHIAIYAVIAAVTAIAALCFGSEHISFANVWADVSAGRMDSVDTVILLQQRLPRVLIGLIAGGSLAIVGAVFQTVLHNPLASPYTLGLAGASSVGAVLAISVGVLSHLNYAGFGMIQLLSMAGALASAMFIYTLARNSGGMSVNTLLLAGVALGIICSAMVMLIRYITSPHLLVSMDRWIMGSLDISGMNAILPMFPLILPGVAILLSMSVSLNHIVFGEELAIGHGVSVVSVQKWTFLAGALTTAAVISLTGPIAFVGLIIPHIVRNISGKDHRVVLPGCLFAGAAFLAICDCFARTLFAPAQMPVGIITAAVGGVFFIALLCRRR